MSIVHFTAFAHVLMWNYDDICCGMSASASDSPGGQGELDKLSCEL